METPPKATSNIEICIIKIMLPVTSDEIAIDKKRKIAEILSDIPEAQIDFRLMSGKPQIPTG